MSEQPEPGQETTERTAIEYLEGRVRELEADNARLVGETDRLIRRIDQLAHRVDAMARASRIYASVRTSIRRPRTLLGLPSELIRVARLPTQPPADSASDSPPASAIAAERRFRAAVETQARFAQGAPHRDPRALRVAIVADEPLVAALAPECELRIVGPTGWETVLDDPPDLLLVQSAWRGRGGWAYRVAWYPHPDAMRLQHLSGLIDGCRQAGVPTVFWDTEGRSHHDRFAPAASRFDQVFSVDPVAVELFASAPERSAAGVDHLPFAAQPRLHNPTGRAAIAGPPVYIGGYARGLPLAERQQLDLLLDAGSGAGLVIFDRHAGSDAEWFAFPERLQANVAGWLPTGSVAGTIRSHRATLVQPTPHLVPARVFEALACGRPVVTTSASAATSLFGAAVLHGSTAAELGRVVAGLKDSPITTDASADATADATIGRIMRADTYRHRLATIARSVGYDVAAGPERIAVLALVDDASLVDRLMALLETLGEAVDEVVVGSTDGDGIGRTCLERVGRMTTVPAVRVVHQAGEAPGSRVRRLAAVAGSDWLHVTDLGHIPSDSSMAAILGAIAYADADVIGAPLDDGPAYASADTVDGRAAVIRRTVLLDRDWSSDPATGRVAMAGWVNDGVRIYAAGPPVGGPGR